MGNKTTDKTAAAAVNPKADEKLPGGIEGSNSQQLEGAAIYRVQHDPQPQLADSNPEPQQCVEAIKQALHLLAYSTTLDVNIPAADGDREIEYASEEQDGEVITVRCRVANRFGRMQSGLLDAVLRQLDFSLSRANDELNGLKRDIRSAMTNMQRSQDPTKLMSFIDGKTRWADVIVDQISHAQMLRDAAHDIYVDLTGRPYIPYEQRRPAPVAIPVPAAGQVLDPVLAKAKALLGS